VDTTEATGIAIDLAANRIYFGVPGGQITGRDLNNPAAILVTLNPVTTFGKTWPSMELSCGGLTVLGGQTVIPAMGIFISRSIGFHSSGWPGTGATCG
jgi:hypothetical protein